MISKFGLFNHSSEHSSECYRNIKLNHDVKPRHNFMPQVDINLYRALTLVGVSLLAACATDPVPPDREIQAAQQSIQQAEQARVADHASVELRTAREKLTSAQTAVREEDMVLGAQLAEQARVEAELALAKTEKENARIVNEEMKKGTQSMQKEMQRHRGMQE